MTAATPGVHPAATPLAPVSGGVGPATVMLDPGNFVPYYVDSLCAALRALGVPVELITSPPLFEKMPRTADYAVRSLFFPFLRGRLGAALRRRRRARQAVKVVSYPLGLLRTWHALRDAPPGVLHIQWALLPLLDRLLIGALRRRGWRVIYTAHDPLPEPVRRVRHEQYRRLLAETDAVVVHTRQEARQIAGAYPEASGRVHVIPHGGVGFPPPSPAERAEMRHALGIDPERPVLLLFGMLKPYKGAEYLVAAMPEVLARFPRALLIIAGEPLMPIRPLGRQIVRLSLTHAVSLRPWFVPREEVPRYLRAADMVVAPYLDIGASGVVALAQGHGIPVVVTRVGGLPEFVEPEACGFVVPARSPSALAHAICRGLADRRALAEMGRRGYHRLARDHSWCEVARRTLALYRGAVVADPARARV